MANRVSVEITAEDKTKAAIDSATRNLGSIASKIPVITGAIAGLAGAAGFGALVKSSIDTADEIGKLAVGFGITAEAASELSYAAKLSGTDINAVGAAMMKTQKFAIDAANGSKTAAGAFQDLGINVREFIRLAPDRQLEVMADALMAVENPSQRNAIAMQMMGESVGRLMPLLEGGAAGLRDMRQEAVDLGLSVSGETAKRAAEFNDNLDRLTSTVTGFGMEVANAALPALNRITEAMVEGARRGGVVKAVLDGLNQSVAELAGVATDGPSEKVLEAQVRLRDLNEQLAKYEVLLKRPEIRNSPAFAALQSQAAALRAEVAGAKEELAAVQMSETNQGAAAPAGTGEDPALASLKERLAARYNAIQTSLYDERETLAQHYVDQMAIIEQAEAAKLGTEEERNALRLALAEQYEQGIEELRLRDEEQEAQHQERLAAISAQGQGAIYSQQAAFLNQLELAQKKQGAESVGIYTNAFAQISAAGAQHSREMFELNKVAGIANAIVSTYQGAAKALDLGWPMGPIAAAMIVANGMAQVSAIQSTSFQGGGKGTTPSAAAAPMINSTPTVPPQIAPASQEARGITTINVTGNESTTYTQAQLDQLMDAFEEAIERGDRVIISRNSRQAQELMGA